MFCDAERTGDGQIALGQITLVVLDHSSVPFVHGLHSIPSNKFHRRRTFLFVLHFHRFFDTSLQSPFLFLLLTFTMTVPFEMNNPNTQRMYGVTFVMSQRGKELPVVDGYVFVCKDKERRRFRCKTSTCRATLVLKQDDRGVFYDRTPHHTHPPHDALLATLEHRNEMRRIARTKQPEVSTRSIVMEVRATCPTTRRLSSDSRFVRRLRGVTSIPKTASDIVFNDGISNFVLFHTQENDIIIFGDLDMVRCASSVAFISIDGTFSRCPVTHTQLVTCHAVCPTGFSFPFVFGLLQDKKASTYTTFLSKSIRFHQRGSE